MKKVYLCLLGIAILILENSITNYITIFGVTIDFLLIFLTIISLYLDDLESSIIGAVLGLLKDISVGGIFGVNALIYFLICYIISYSRKKIYKESKVTIFTLILATTIFSSVLNILASIVVYSSFTAVRLMIRGIVILPILNSIMALILYKAFDKSILKLKED
ncbi:MAG: rod shape-determining protein MreD [Terrisporobacter othiniensis]|uniref:Rod shape-determining protein MreD n=1 Tax=Terrisporobacter othiniensis TaxID=1577792 RepID=A0A0B3VVD2_9FIRM|nr:rod shape-determining protein MreD [Terrisporobacter othiniensis]KHS56788.1 rod shape-determining protein MreD [Terrisporobacter othiniensis]MDU6985145.1 rod shape-determining protein MreD [Terrisporobacter othiniensis]